MRLALTLEDILAQTSNGGHCEFTADPEGIRHFIQALRKLKFAVSKTDLRVKEKWKSRENTLSARHGSAAFPFHTDYAFRAAPPRYLLLFNPTNVYFQRSTLIAPFNSLSPSLQQQIQRSTWRLIASNKHYLVSGQFLRNSKKVWRWDCDFLKSG